MTDLLGDNAPVKEAALTELTQLTEPEQRSAMEFTIRQGRGLADIDVLLEMTIRWADQTPGLVDLVTGAADEMITRLGPGVPASMGGSPMRARYLPIIERLATQDGIDSMVQTAARMELESNSGN